MLRKTIGMLMVVLTLTGCTQSRKHTISLVMTFHDEWTGQMRQVMSYEVQQYPHLEMKNYMEDVDASPESKAALLDSILDHGTDLLLVGNDHPGLANAIAKARKRGIPVIIMGPTKGLPETEAHVNIDDVEMATRMGRYVCDHLNGATNVLEITGPIHLPYAKDRYTGFHSVFDTCHSIHLITIEGDYSRLDAKKKVEKLISQLQAPIDIVVGYNDRMALGAREALMTNPKTKNWRVRYMGVDCLVNDTIGVGRVEDGSLEASMLWGTGGEEVIRTAMKILQGEPYEREITPISGVITRENTSIIRREWQKMSEKARLMCEANEKIQQEKQHSTMLQIVLILLVLFTCAALYLYYIMHRYNRKLRQHNQELAEQKEIAEMQRDQLERERERVIEMQLREATPPEISSENVSEEDQRFHQRLDEVIENNLSNESLTVEMISEQMRYGRVQLYRRTKQACGMSPNEYLRATRLNRARKLLQDGKMNVSEVSYAVGFSSPRYFSKCYKDQFGCLPSEMK